MKIPFEVEKAYQTTQVYPPKDQLFKALELCPIEKAKVLILGQDPYYRPGQAMGLAFSVPQGTKMPPSLKNIFKELELEYGQVRTNPDLSDWARQGVLLLNTSLSVEEGKPASHMAYWQDFREEIITQLNQKESLVALLWGSHAQSWQAQLNPHFHFLTTSHPSPLSCHRGFLGCQHFRLANQWLDEPINWFLAP